MAINPEDYKLGYIDPQTGRKIPFQGRSIDDDILDGLITVIPYSDAEIESSRLANNIPNDYVTIRTAVGGFVFVNPRFPDIVDAYRSGLLTGGFSEVAAGGVGLKSLPRIEPQCPSAGTLDRCEGEYAFRFTGTRNPNTRECLTELDTVSIEPRCRQPVQENPPTPTPTPTPTPARPTPSPFVPPPTPTPSPTPTLTKKQNYKVAGNIEVRILSVEKPIVSKSTISITVFPVPTKVQQLELVYPFTINTLPISINISDPLITSAYAFLLDAITNYVDEERDLKTLLNYGEDKQTVALSYRYGLPDENNVNAIQLKLLQPVPADIDVGTNVFLSREVAKSVIDKVRVRFAPPLDATPYLRPRNLKAKNGVDTGKSLTNITLNVLKLQSGSVGREDEYKNKSFEDEIFRQWYSYDFDSSELNIDFTDYNNFVFYGSSAMRLAAFREKLLSLEKLEQSRLQFLSSSTYMGTTGSGAFLFVQEKSAEYAKEKEDIIRSFDRYEQYLYFTPSGSNSPYTASAYYADEGYEYNSIGYWPKTVSGSVYSVYSSTASDWYETQSLIAQRFDEFNENNLVNTIPTHIREHEENAPYITFITMIGHFFDIIKPYIDQFPNIYSRNLNPNEELSKDLINEIAESIGFTLPTLNSTYDLTNNILGTENETSRRDLTAEIYKRLLHNLPFFAKAKGTKTSLDALLKTFGITSQLISVKETGTPTTASYAVFDEYTTGLDFDETVASYVAFPLQASARSPKALQFNCTIAKPHTMTVLTGDVAWALHAVPHPTISTLGKFELTSGSNNTIILSSSYQEIFGDELLNVAIQVDDSESSLYVTQVEGEDIIFSSIATETSSFANLWNNTQFIYLGGAGSRVINRFDGTLDELRLWKNTLSDEVILNTAFDPASSAGDTYKDASDNLLIQLSFNNVDLAYLQASSSIHNESPYKDIAVSPSLEVIQCNNVSTSDFSRYNRTIRQAVPEVGTSAFITNKIKVAQAPVFPEMQNGLRLYRNKSIVPPVQKRYQRGRNKVIIGMSPTEIVNQNIIRNFGLENINAVLGAPSSLYTTFEKSLANLKKHYQQYYRIDVNTNRFIRLMSDLNSVLNQMMDYFIPAKATALQGIIIEPNILEQVKIPPVKNIRFYGKDTRKTLQAPGSLTGSNSDYGATFNPDNAIVDMLPSTIGTHTDFKGSIQKETTLRGNYSVQTGSIDMDMSQLDAKTNNFTGQTTAFDEVSVSSMINSYVSSVELEMNSSLSASYSAYKTNIRRDFNNIISSSYAVFGNKHQDWKYSGPDQPSSIKIDLSNVNKLKFNSKNNGSPGAEPYNRLYTRKLFASEITTPRQAGDTSLYIPALYDIPPSTDFRDFGVYTYFNNPEGIYYFEEMRKKPAYPNQLNQAWNEGLQKFDTATSWSYGARYNINDVVYQNIKDDTESLGNLAKSARSGNGFYYVFKTRPAYRPTDDGTAFYSGSVPSYLPPSLDKENWEILRFTPFIKRVPKRVVYDTYVNRNVALNNFKTTTISVNSIIDVPDRYIQSYNLPLLQPNSYVVGDLSVENISLLFALQSNTTNIRIRLYRTNTARNDDLNRPYNVLPTGSHGVLLDTTVTSPAVVELSNPIPTLVADGTPPGGVIYYTINNLDSTTKLGTYLTLFYFALQIQPKIPVGYLKKHYRFFRDNSTGTKRRNYLGCKNTQSTTIDGLPPIQVFLSEGTEITVSPTQTNQEIITGGGGTLNVT